MTPKKRLKAFDPDDIAYVKAVEKELRALSPAKREVRRAELMKNTDEELQLLAQSLGGEVVDWYMLDTILLIIESIIAVIMIAVVLGIVLDGLFGKHNQS